MKAAGTCRGAAGLASWPWTAPRRGRSEAASLHLVVSFGTRVRHSLWRRYAYRRLSLRHHRQHRRSAFHSLSGLYAQNCLRRKNDIRPRSKLDETHSLPTFHSIALAIIKYDASSDQAGNLLEHNLHPVAAHRRDVLLVAVGRIGILGIQIQALLIADRGEHAADRRTVHVYIENIQEDADALPGAFGSFDRYRLR